MLLADSKMDLPFLEALSEEETRFKRFSMTGTSDVRVAGNIRTGFTINVDKHEEPATAEPGVCCLPDGTCEVVTFGQCLIDGGLFQGSGTVCEDFDCTHGACCHEDGTCTIETEVDCDGDFQGNGTICDPTGACCMGSDCIITNEDCCNNAGGTYQGDDTECDPNPCPTPTGACCVGTDCSIETEDDCTDMGGVYQGDDTVCDPNPCEIIPSPCCDEFGFPGNIDGTTRFLKKTINYVYNDEEHDPGVPCTGHWDQTSVYTIDPTTCETTVTCFGSGSRVYEDEEFDWTWGLTFTGDCGCIGGPCGPCEPNSCSGLSGASTVISNTEKQDTCSDADPFGRWTSSATITETLSEPCIQT